MAIPALTCASLIISPPPPLPPTFPETEATSSADFRRMNYELAPAPRLAPMGVYVGELQEKWQFPSDHLPIGMTLDNLNFASWNVLDEKTMKWVTVKNSQGLSRSLIADEHVYIDKTKLTIRDRHVAALILEMLQHPTHPKQFLAMQECSESFLQELKGSLPPNFTLIAHQDRAIVIDTSHFEIIKAEPATGIFSDEPERSVQNIILKRKDTSQLIRLINAHVPGNPDKPARQEFAQYLAKTFDPKLITVALGDMNFNELEMGDAIRGAFAGTEQPFSLYSPYCTNISPQVFNSKVIDHFFVAGSPVTIHKPEEVMIGLTPTWNLLNP